jgi:hypothetical protein
MGIIFENGTIPGERIEDPIRTVLGNSTTAGSAWIKLY